MTAAERKNAVRAICNRFLAQNSNFYGAGSEVGSDTGQNIDRQQLNDVARRIVDSIDQGMTVVFL